MKRYGHTVEINCSFEEAVRMVKKALINEGFGVLCEIHVSKVLKEKINKDIGDYTILGACNPLLSYEAISAEKEVGLLLPCNVIIYREKDRLLVSSILPKMLVAETKNETLISVADKAEKKLLKVINNL